MTTENNNPEEIIPVDQNQKTDANPATQTLFRFVSLRNPQLAKKEGNTKFIFRQENYRGVFDELLLLWKPQLNKSKIDFLTEKVKSADFNFGYIQRTESNVQSWFGNFYTSSKNLIANGSLPADEVQDLLDIISEFEQDDTKRKELFGGLWDSIIYQILTEEDFYVKELLTQILQTIHYVNNYRLIAEESNAKKRLAKQKELSTAKVVIPDYLFVDTVTVPPVTQSKDFTVGVSKVGSSDTISNGNHKNGILATESENNTSENPAVFLPTESMLKRQKVALANVEKEQLEKLKKELSKAQKLYHKEYSKAYDLATKQYQKSIMPEREAYEQRLLEVEAAFTEEMAEAAKKLALSQVPKPQLPDFEFEFRAERDTTYLQAKLSESSLFTLAKLIAESVAEDDLSDRLSNGDVAAENVLAVGKEQYIFPADENQNFEEMLETLNARLSELNEEIYQNTEIEKQEYASVGGVLIPVNNHLSNKGTSFNFNVKTIVRATNYWSVLMTFEDKSIKIISADYKAHGKTKDIQDTYLQEAVNGVYILFNNQNFISPADVSESGFVVDGIVKLSDNNYYNFSVTLFRNYSVSLNASDNQYYNGPGYNSSLMLIGPNLPGTGGTETPTNPGDTGTPSNPGTTTPSSSTNSFIPKGFGIKRLGIADYLKVEQTTHAYVEGEVANIENIMAREYRSQSTRRLRRSETIDTKSSDTERERSTDTTTSSRFEMQSEIAKILQESTDMGINANTSFEALGAKFSIGASYANHRSKEESMRQAVSQAQEVTARALDRVVTKVHQERVEKMIEEFEENNTHGFDNRKGDQHVVGVYRWVDKLMKNQVWNYGKRLMFEFAIPQPSKLHTLAAASVKKVIEKPVDPRDSKDFPMINSSAVVEGATLKHWISKYNVELENIPQDNIALGKSLSGSYLGTISEIEYFNVTDNLEIPEGYEAINGMVSITATDDGDWNSIGVATLFGDQKVSFGGNRLQCQSSEFKTFFSPFSKTVPLSATYSNYFTGTANFVINCRLSETAKKQWQQKTFNAIIEAYEEALADYNDKVAQEEAKAGNIKDSNPMFYRQIEQEVLKHNSIAYLVDDSTSNKVLGKTLYNGTTVAGFEVARTGLDAYASLAKFMEQAFEWDLMSYNYYPYYWGRRDDWDDMYQQENIDPLFRSFLRSGMARVVVTVRPGFEDAVQFYMATGRLWNGGEVPVIGDPMYLSIVDELKETKGEAQGKAWLTRLPTSLTILQAESIGLKVASALPFTKEDPEDFENPEQVITTSNFVTTRAMIESGTDRQVANLELDTDSLQLTTETNEVVSELPLDELKKALE
ncbi:hypothetical protein [Epilithonimonas sp.]|uniref:hypothetical protein n=1 Tax=Epilithonimonas sp. TaxID=2894511 RepID=UPI0035B3B6E3